MSCFWLREASAQPLRLHSDRDTQSPRKGSSQSWGPGQEWTKLEADTVEEKLLLQVDEAAWREAMERECWWGAWLEVSRARGRAGHSQTGAVSSVPLPRPWSDGVSDGSKLNNPPDQGLPGLSQPPPPPRPAALHGAAALLMLFSAHQLPAPPIFLSFL